ncbi:MAG: DUF1579 domain-containing protein [Armatimonadetes bacterium]|nr:DUF1579 domain-containing protein [Akkermansiaceae bacterium]
MKNIAITAILTLIACQSLPAETPEMPPPTKEHLWLAQLAGEWESDTEIFMEPGKPPVKAKGTESIKMIGGFWAVGEANAEMMGEPWKAVSTFGYDPGKKHYISTWVDSMTSTMWKYEGKMEGDVLELETEGLCMMTGEQCQFKARIEFKSPDIRTFTETKQEKDGTWVTVINATYTRKK